jgi:hypothetical protein
MMLHIGDTEYDLKTAISTIESNINSLRREAQELEVMETPDSLSGHFLAVNIEKQQKILSWMRWHALRTNSPR